MLTLATLSLIILSCSSEQLSDKMEGKWAVAGFRITSGLEQLDSLSRMQLEFQLMQYRMLNVQYMFTKDGKYKMFILNDSLFDEGTFNLQDSMVIFKSTKTPNGDTIKIVKLTEDTLEFGPAVKPKAQQPVLTVNMILVKRGSSN